jgi:hypothetical protein
MVLVTVDGEARTGAREVLEQMDGDPGRLFEILGAD